MDRGHINICITLYPLSSSLNVIENDVHKQSAEFNASGALTIDNGTVSFYVSHHVVLVKQRGPVLIRVSWKSWNIPLMLGHLYLVFGICVHAVTLLICVCVYAHLDTFTGCYGNSSTSWTRGRCTVWTAEDQWWGESVLIMGTNSLNSQSNQWELIKTVMWQPVIFPPSVCL